MFTSQPLTGTFIANPVKVSSPIFMKHIIYWWEFTSRLSPGSLPSSGSVFFLKRYLWSITSGIGFDVDLICMV